MIALLDRAILAVVSCFFITLNISPTAHLFYWILLTCMSISFTKLGKFSFIIFSNRFPISCSFSSSDTPVMQMLDHLKLSQRLLTLSLFFWILLSACYSDWLFFASLCSKSLILLSALFPLLLFPFKLFSISIIRNLFHF